MATEQKLSLREREIMDAIYRLGRATAREVQEKLPDELANATVRTMLRILEEKGHLRHIEEGRRFVYSPTRPRSREAKGAMQRLVGVFYEGSVASAMAGLLQMKDTRLSDQEVEELSALIESARAGTKEKKGGAGKK